MKNRQRMNSRKYIWMHLIKSRNRSLTSCMGASIKSSIQKRKKNTLFISHNYPSFTSPLQMSYRKKAGSGVIFSCLNQTIRSQTSSSESITAATGPIGIYQKNLFESNFGKMWKG